jgi:hypothetical protein
MFLPRIILLPFLLASSSILFFFYVAWTNFGTWLPCCCGFETLEFIRGEDVSLRPPKNIN